MDIHEVGSQPGQLASNRAFLYGDGVFETVKIVAGHILFLEDHYFRLMSAMRIVRMEIPMELTLEFFADQLLLAASNAGCAESARARITVYRNDGGTYLPTTRTVSFVITAGSLPLTAYTLSFAPYEVDLYKDFYVSRHLLSTVKTTNKMIHVTGSIYAQENDLQNCLLLNDSKNVTEALNGNIFVVVENKVSTPPLSEGCLNGVMRKQIIRHSASLGYEVVEEVLSPFDLQKADELFITNVVMGIQPITKYRKKEYTLNTAVKFTDAINTEVANLT